MITEEGTIIDTTELELEAGAVAENNEGGGQQQQTTITNFDVDEMR